MSSTYLITTDDGRIVVNTGMWFEARTHKRNYDAVTTAPTRYIILTQSHTDHIGGVDTFREDGTQLIAQANITACQADDERIHGLAHPALAPVLRRRHGPDRASPAATTRRSRRLPKPAHADITFDATYEFTCGGRRIELISVPGGETIDSLVVWLPDDGVALVGNMFSALFGHFPNLVTVRGDRMRSALAFVDSVQRVIDLEPELLLLGHHGPVRGATIRIGVRADPRRGAVRARRDGRGDERRPRRVDRDAEIRLPEALDLGEAYGRVDWSVRAIWETYAGWIHQHSTLELYGAPPEQGASEIVALAGGTDAVAERAAALATTDPLTAVRLCELALAVDGEHRGALDAYRRAHEQLLVEHGRANFWLTRWLEGEVRSATNRLERLGARRDDARPIPHRRPARAAPRRAASARALDYVATLDIRFDADAMLAQARDRARCDDFGAPDFRAASTR